MFKLCRAFRETTDANTSISTKFFSNIENRNIYCFIDYDIGLFFYSFVMY